MQLIQEHHWPERLSAQHRGLSDAARARLAQGDYNAAAAGFEAAYRLLLTTQPEGRRYHKGESLHNRGLALLWAGRTAEALEETVAAFIEDAASLAEEDRRYLELERPAAHNLVYVFGLAGPPLAQFARQVRGLILSGELLPDPHRLLLTAGAEAASSTRSAAAPTRTIGQHRLGPDRRVFIGGGFLRLETHLRPLRDMVDALGYEGVVAADYGIPHGWRDDDVALGLMGVCHFGIFDLTDPAGQMVELATLPDRKRSPGRTLAVWDLREAEAPRVSHGMTLEPLADWGVVPQGYADLEELGRITGGWLAGSPPSA